LNNATQGTFYYYAMVTNTNNRATGNKSATAASDVIKVIVRPGIRTSSYLIATAGQLAALAAAVNAGNTAYNSAGYVLENNIDLSRYASWIPIGTLDNPFRGVFDGNGKVINGLFINSPEAIHQGLFGVLSGGTVKTLGVEGVAITGRYRLGGIAGHVVNSATISNCYTTGDIYAVENNAGGIAGWVTQGSVIENCYTTVAGKVDVQRVGGIAGLVSGSTIRNCAALNPSIVGRDSGRINSSGGTRQNNAAFAGMLNTDGTTTWSGTAMTGNSGANITAAQIRADGTLGGRFTAANGWTVQNGKLPGFGQAREGPEHLQ
jgi:hypothetical protein